MPLIYNLLHIFILFFIISKDYILLKVVVMSKNQFDYQEEVPLISELSVVNKSNQIDLLDAEDLSLSQLNSEASRLKTETCHSIPRQTLEDINDESREAQKRETFIESLDAGLVLDKQKNEFKDFVGQTLCEKQDYPTANTSQSTPSEYQQRLAIKALIAQTMNDIGNIDIILKKQKERRLKFEKQLQNLIAQFRAQQNILFKQEMLEIKQSRLKGLRSTQQKPPAHSTKTEAKGKKGEDSWFIATMKRWFSCIKEEEKQPQ